MDIIYLMCFIVAGLILGLIFFQRPKITGELVIDTRDETTDRWLIRLYEPTERTAGRGVVVLRIVNRPITEEDKWPEEK